MKLRYLGTAAAEGWPAVFCRCPHCDRARAAGGKNIRTRSQALINSDMLIDFPPDANMHMLMNNIDYSAIKFLLVTHPHSDHFAPLDLAFRDDAYYAHNLTEEKLILAGPKRVIDAYENYFGRFSDERRCKYITPMVLENYVTYELGDYKVTPVRANHTLDENNACCYIIEENGKTLYLQAVIAARPNDVEKSLKHLAKAIKKDHKIKKMAKDDMEFAYIQDSPEFIALVE